MRYSLLVFAAALVAASAANAAAPTLSELVDRCRGNAQSCQADIGDYITSASQNHLICMPKDVSHNGAIDDMLDWLRQANSEKPAMANGSADDAEWDAVNALWPCHKD